MDILNKVKKESAGKSPPKRTIKIMVKIVSLNPEIEYYCWAPLFGLGWPLTIFAGKIREAKQI